MVSNEKKIEKGKKKELEKKKEDREERKKKKISIPVSLSCEPKSPLGVK